MITPRHLAVASAFAVSLLAAPAFADTIDPPEYSNTLAMGESVTISKTVVIEEGGPTEALIDVHFLIDTSGSMSGEINAAKAAATDLFNEITSRFGDVAASVGVFSEGASLTDPDIKGRAIIGDLTTNVATFQANVNQVTLNNPDGGGDFPESGYTGIKLATVGDGTNPGLSWRPGSNRFMFVFTDASAKGDLTGAQAALVAEDVNLVTLSYGSLPTITASYGPGVFPGAEVFASTTSVEGIIDDVTEGISIGFENYTTVSVDDLGAGLAEGIEVSSVCTSADIGACVGADAVGVYNRSEDRTFTFDVTFKRVGAGEGTFLTNALVDGGIVARERDTFKDGGGTVVPLPAGLPLLLTAFGGLAYLRRRRAA